MSMEYFSYHIKNPRTRFFQAFPRILPRAIDGARTRGLDLGKVARYQLRHYRISGWWESNPRIQLGRLVFYHWTTPAQLVVCASLSHQRRLVYMMKLYLSTLNLNFFYFFDNTVTVHFVLSNVVKIYSRLPAAMEFWLACLGILVYSCHNIPNHPHFRYVMALVSKINQNSFIFTAF